MLRPVTVFQTAFEITFRLIRISLQTWRKRLNAVLHFHKTATSQRKASISCSSYDRKFCNHTRKSKVCLPVAEKGLVLRFIAKCTVHTKLCFPPQHSPPSPPADHTSVRALQKTRLAVFSNIPQLLEFLRQIIFALYLQSKLNQGFLVRVVIAYLIFAFELFIFQMIQGSPCKRYGRVGSRLHSTPCRQAGGDAAGK